MNPVKLFSFVVCVLYSGLVSTRCHAQWPGFLGAGAAAIQPDSIPKKWNEQENIAWTADIKGYGQSSPVVWGEKVFVTSVDGSNKESLQVFCLDTKSGRQLWKQTVPSTMPAENSLYVSRAAPTPVVDQSRLVTFFESGDLVAFDHAGKELWRRSLTQEYGKFQNEFGLSGSPVQTDESVIVLVDDDHVGYLAAFSKLDGKTLWKTDRSPRRSWSSPVLMNISGTTQIVVSSAGSVDGYAAETGELLWTFTDVGGNTGTTPISCGDGLFTVGASPGREGQNAELAKKSNFVMQVSKQGEQWTAAPKWSTQEATPSWASPIVHQGFAYWVNRVGVVYCYHVETGELAYKERIAQQCWATPLGVGDKVYFFGKDGVTTVLAAGAEFQVLAENRLWDPASVKPNTELAQREKTEERRKAAAMFSGPTVYGYAVSEGSIFVRIGSKLFCIRDT